MPAAKGTRPPRAGLGRPKGVPNKLTADVKDMILGALADAGGQEYLTQQAKDNPAAFLSLLGRVLPKQIDANVQGELRQHYVAEVPAVAPNVEEWLKQYAPPTS